MTCRKFCIKGAPPLFDTKTIRFLDVFGHILAFPMFLAPLMENLRYSAISYKFIMEFSIFQKSEKIEIS